MSVEEIVRVVESNAQAEAEAIVATARTSAATLVAAAEAAAEARVREACERAEPGYRAEAMRLVNTARLRLLEQRAARSASLVDAVSEAAAARLAIIAAEPGGARWPSALARLMDETAGLIGPGGVLVVRAVDAAAARPTATRLGCRLEVMGAGVDAGQGAPGAVSAPAPGVLGRSADGRVEVDATLPARLERARVLLAEPVARLLGVDT
jgi:vacuolar-type H+-ATPase subunit E/Vma4